MGTQYDNISVTAFIFWNGKALLVQRADDDDFLPGYWEQVGGKVESGETQKDAVVREIREEAGINVKPLHSYNQFEYTHPDGRAICEYAYICELIGEPSVILSHEHQAYQWITPEDIENVQLMTDSLRGVVRQGFQEVKHYISE